MKITIVRFLLAVSILSVSGCGPPKVSSVCQNPAYYQQNIVIREALFIRERNCSLHILASAFLIDRERGLFASAKHFIGSESDGKAKVFFNGRVYDGFLVWLPPVTDVAIIKIAGNYDPASFPEPYKVAQNIKVGDKVFVRGIHPHPAALQGNKIILPILRGYYGVLGKNEEFVHDDLEGKITDIAAKIQNKNIVGSSELLSEVTNTYIKLETKEDHLFSFGGLSGGPTVNEESELVGINSSEQGGYLELTERGIEYHPWKTFHLVPASELEKLMPMIANIK
ncbi:MAG: trypsin-like peptidase domain-containing protein [Candidatus Yanofskybacteria bacterium]|nr:trypsin-like peptidase domain-containing protein [Candidatus Yanofskybacteria bacterium]